MFKNAFMKDVIGDIKKSKGRFFSIFAIIALGVAFFSGIKVSPVDMKRTADKYYDDYNFMDLTLYSTLGFTDDDIAELSKVNGVLDVFPTYSLDAITTIDSSENVLKVMGIPLNSDSYVNKYKLIEGKLPENPNECVLEAGKLESLKLSIGSKIKLESGTSELLSDKLEIVEYEVVGKVQTPYYLSFEKGTSSIGSGKISSFIVIPQENFKIPAYTEAYVTVDSAKKLNSYSDKYFNLIDNVRYPLEELGEDRASIRYNEIVSEANKKIIEGKEELENQKIKGKEELDKAKKKLEESEIALKDGESELAKKENEFNVSIMKAENQISLSEYTISDGKVALESAKNAFQAEKLNAEKQMDIAKSTLLTLNDTKTGLNEEITKVKLALKVPNISEEEKNKLNIQLEVLTRSMDELVKGIEYISNEIQSGEEKLRLAESEITNKENELINGEKLLNEKKIQLEVSKNEAVNQFESSKLQLENGKNELQKGKEEYEKSKETFEREIASAEAKIKKAENDVKSIEEPSWYILDRNSHYSYVDYKNNADSIDKLARIFPVFFFLVAALICLTTMTRMVDEQRINIGTLKALGYSKSKIVSKYLIYSFLASFLGSIVGLAIGLTVFPIVVFDAYGIMYTLPKVELEFNIPIAISITVIAILVTTLSSFFACYKELSETPSALMRPKAPKNGKRILVERVNFIWSKLSFIGKVTVRNIFRYKKRFFMTVFGIAGCTALIVTGFGIKDSIKTIVDKQYGDIFKYNLTINIDKDASDLEKQDIFSDISSLKEVDKLLMVQSESAKIVTDDGDKDIYIIVPESLDKFDQFINLKNRLSKEEIKLKNDGVILSEKAAKKANVKLGDEVKIKVNNREILMNVSGIAENYTFNYVYMSSKYYKEKFDINSNFNSILVNTSIIEDEDKFSKTIMEKSIVKSVSFNAGIKDNFDNTIKSLNYVVLVMIVSAGALAFVVLYNLTNVNISERMREIATIKVLGFYDNEVSAYIYRENIILTLFGIVFGEFLGIFLHRFIMVTVEMDNIMFGRNIDLLSFLISALLTIIFAVLVNIVMYYKLKKVEMIESLKSVD
ncbi:ABC transporter permease [Clostridium sp. D46t1_190503_E9]|uniref:ABC transporter permease n=1 Tax=Clostridium sp. D46t1_190503_E9 TaxID=2787137 RepID=UPI001896E619|nr:ABC transporter permease [Clostridium sp. D46t1_190503_E9]